MHYQNTYRHYKQTKMQWWLMTVIQRGTSLAQWNEEMNIPPLYKGHDNRTIISNTK